MNLIPYTQGRLTLIIGPVRSGKTTRLEGILDSAVDSGLMNDSNIIIVKHPEDDRGSNNIGKHHCNISSHPNNIVNLVKTKTRTIIIPGIGHHESLDIVPLVDGLLRSDRNVIATSLNLDSNGKPYGHLPELMALADEVIIEKAICSKSECKSHATRSMLIQNTFEPRCTHHYHFEESPARGVDGGLKLFLGPMYSSKSLNWYKHIKSLEMAEEKFLTFKWIGDKRGDEREIVKKFDTGYVVLKSGKKIPATLIENTEDIYDYLKQKPGIKNLFIDEYEFIAESYEFTFDMLKKGYNIYGTGLPRAFNRKGFGDVPKLMCLADRIEMLNSYCFICHHPASENQRFKKEGDNYITAHINDPLVIVDDNRTNDKYEPVCLRHWKLRGEPDLKYEFPIYTNN